MTNFKLIEATLRMKYPENVEEIPKKKPKRDNTTVVPKTTTVWPKATALIESSASIKPATSTKIMQKFTMNEEVFYFDNHSHRMEPGTILEVISPTIFKIINNQRAVFHINSKFLGKK